MENEELKYVLFDISQLSEVEKDIILVLGDDIINPPVPHINRLNAKYMLKTKALLDKYDSDTLFENISLLCLKDIISLDCSTSTPNNNFNYFTPNYSSLSDLDTLLELIVVRLIANNRLLTKEAKNIFAITPPFDKSMNNTKDSLIEKLKKITKKKKHIRINGILDLCKKYINYFNNPNDDNLINNDRKINLNGAIQHATLILEIYQEKSITDALRLIVTKFYDKDIVLLYKYIRLTNHKHGNNGIQVLNALRMEEIQNNYQNLLNESIKIKKEIDKHLIRIVEIISIFIAILTIIIGNVSFVPQISAKTTLGAVSLILIINGSLITGITVMMIFISKITNSNIKSKFLSIILSVVVFITLGGGITLSIIENGNININQDSTNNLTIENNINTLNSVENEPSNNTTENVPTNNPILESTSTLSPSQSE